MTKNVAIERLCGEINNKQTIGIYQVEIASGQEPQILGIISDIGK